MTTRATITVTTNRAPPRRRHIPDRPPVDRETTVLPLTTHRDELARAIEEIAELDKQMIQIDQDINHQIDRLGADDPWAVIDGEAAIAALEGQRSKASWAVMFAANRAIHHGACLIDAWREVDVDNVARDLSQDGPVFARLRAEWPAIADDPVWQRLEAEACPF